MPVSKPLLLTLAFVVAQTWVPQTACDRRIPPPSSGEDPWDNAPVTETMTTADGVRIGVQVLLTNRQVPWSLAFAPDGRLFFTERAGRVRVVQNGALLAPPALTLTDVRAVLDAGNSTVPAAQERLFEGRFGRIRDVITGPDGALYFCTSNRDGRTTPVATDDRIARIVPVQ